MERRWTARQALLVLPATVALAFAGSGCRAADDRVSAAAPSSPTHAVATATDAPSGPAPVAGDRSERFAVAEAVVAELAVYDGATATVPVRTLAHPNEEGAPLVLAVLDRAGDRLQVALPVRPNGSTGWVDAADVAVRTHSFRIEIRLAERELRVFDGDEIVQLEPIGVGQEPTPTPGGSFYLYELLQPPDPNGPYGPYAFGLSGFSEALTTFDGGDGRLGLHGTDDPASIGTDSTHGCIRLANDAIVQLAHTVPLGTPVAIFG
ncbi:MAG: L,D-transpeptidase [Acidimicrobiales bacterium]